MTAADALIALLLCAALLLAATFLAASRRPCVPVVFAYPGGVELVGRGRPGKLRFNIVQWHREPCGPAACPLIVHLPGGDLGGEELCRWNTAQATVELGAGSGFDLFPFHGPTGDVVGLRVGLIPGGRPFELTVNGVRVRVPLSEMEARIALGEPHGTAGLA